VTPQTAVPSAHPAAGRRRRLATTIGLALMAACLLPWGARADGALYGPELEGFRYPFPVERFTFPSQGRTLSMAFMDVAPTAPNGRTVVLLHGKNFCGATWEATIRQLGDAGYRVIAPDQIGFCQSTKPEHYQYTLHQLATNTKALLASRGVDRAVIVGHSMGGMIAARYALMFPDAVARLVMINPLGLEDWKAEGVPYATVDQNLQAELRTTAETIRNYQLRYYYNGVWKPEYDRWVEMAAGLYAGSGRALVAWNQALTSDMIFTQPVVHEFGSLRVPTLLMIGGKDRTAPGAARASPEIAKRLGNYPELGRRAASAIPGAVLVEFPDLGHSPQVEAPARFHEAFLKALAE
jgi:pimeloyl-ACP methyl ester carboxylesterase